MCVRVCVRVCVSVCVCKFAVAVLRCLCGRALKEAKQKTSLYPDGRSLFVVRCACVLFAVVCCCLWLLLVVFGCCFLFVA